MHADQGPSPGFHVTGYIESALVCSQCDIAAMAFGGPPCSTYIPLLDYFADGNLSAIAYEHDGTIAIELDFFGEVDFTGTANTLEHRGGDRNRLVDGVQVDAMIICVLYVHQVCA